MKKHSPILLLSLLLLLSLPAQAAAPVPGHIEVSGQGLLVDGEEKTVQKYNIDGANYFKLRDIAFLLNGTGAQFSVGWDSAAATVTVTGGEAYAPNGGELTVGRDLSASAVPSAQTVWINGAERSDLSVYNIGNENYFKLRDLGRAIGFAVDFDAEANAAVVDTREAGEPQVPIGPGVIPEAPERPAPDGGTPPSGTPGELPDKAGAEQGAPEPPAGPQAGPEGPAADPAGAGAETAEPAPEAQLSVAGKTYALGMSEAALTALAGEPADRQPSTRGFTWYVFGTESYLDFFLAGVQDGRVVTLASGGKGFSWMGRSAGSKDADGADGVTLYTDKNDGGILHAIRLSARAGLAGGTDTSAAALHGESVINFHMVNAFRVYHGLPAFRWSEAAAEAARLHSEDMAANDYFEHDSLDGREPWDRMGAQGIRYRAAAENISAGRSDGVSCYDGWVNSSGHRSNMLGGCEQLGVGAGYNKASAYGWYMTQDFFTGL